jgi:hypothetical protein
VFVLADALSSRLEIPVKWDAVERTREVPELKNVYELKERLRLLAGAHTGKARVVSGKKVLLFDDLFRSGIHRREHLPVVAQKRHPRCSGWPARPKCPHVPGYGALRDPKAEFEQFSVDPRRSPPVLLHHASNQLTQFLVGSGPSWFAAEVTPVDAVGSSVPGDNGCGFHDCQEAGPVGPDLPECDPERTIDRDQFRASATANCAGELLSEGEVFQDQGSARTRQGANGPEHHFEDEEHRGSMRGLSDDGKFRSERIPVSSGFRIQNAADGILASHNDDPTRW